MDIQKRKLNKLKEEQKAKTKKQDLLNSYINSLNNFEDKIAAVKINQRLDKSTFVSSFKSLMKKK